MDQTNRRSIFCSHAIPRIPAVRSGTCLISRRYQFLRLQHLTMHFGKSDNPPRCTLAQPWVSKLTYTPCVWLLWIWQSCCSNRGTLASLQRHHVTGRLAAAHRYIHLILKLIKSWTRKEFSYSYTIIRRLLWLGRPRPRCEPIQGCCCCRHFLIAYTTIGQTSLRLGHHSCHVIWCHQRT